MLSFMCVGYLWFLLHMLSLQCDSARSVRVAFCSLCMHSPVLIMHEDIKKSMKKDHSCISDWVTVPNLPTCPTVNHPYQVETH